MEKTKQGPPQRPGPIPGLMGCPTPPREEPAPAPQKPEK